MSEIEKRCPRCGGSGEQEDGDCGRCGGYGTVVDVEGQLRAEVARLTKQHADELTLIRISRDARLAAYDAALRVRDETVLKASQEAARLTEERDTWRGAYERGVADCERLTVAIAERDGEVARLEGRETAATALLRAFRQGDLTFADARAWLAGCKS